LVFPITKVFRQSPPPHTLLQFAEGQQWNFEDRHRLDNLHRVENNESEYSSLAAESWGAIHARPEWRNKAMSSMPQSSMTNKLLQILPARDYVQIVQDLEFIELDRATVLVHAGEPIDHIYFLTSGIGSIIATTPDGNRVEAGIFGADGYVPTSAVASAERSPHDVVIQLRSQAYRMDYGKFRGWMDTNRNFSKVMIRSIEAFSIQLTYTAVSNAMHDVTERLARWLLMCHDRVSGNEIGLTHEFISLMLAVRRPSVTTSLHILEGNGFIRSERGNIIIRNRPAMEDFARDAYGKPEEEYRRLMKDLF